MIKIIQISDLHLTADHHKIWGVDTSANFRKSIERLSDIDDIDAIIVTGDISDDGSVESYLFADQMFKGTRIPTYWCPGNHDSIDFFRTHKPIYSQMTRSVVIKGYRFIFANSIVPDADNPSKNRSRGIITDKEFEEIGQMLSIDDRPVIVAMHHPTYIMGNWLDDKILVNKDQFNSFISNGRVKLILFGHVHHFHIYKEDDPMVVSASSVGFAFNDGLPKYRVEHGKEGFSIIEIDNEISISIKNITL